MSWGYSRPEAIQEGLVKLFDATVKGVEMVNVTNYMATALYKQEAGKFRRAKIAPEVYIDDYGNAELVAKTYDKLTGDFEVMIDSLPEKDKQLMRDLHVERYSYKEVAEMYDIKLGTVKSRSWRIHQKLRLHSV